MTSVAARIDLWRMRINSQLFPPADIKSLLEKLSSNPADTLFVQLVHEATDVVGIASRLHNASTTAVEEHACGILDDLDGKHAYVQQMLNNMKVLLLMDIFAEERRARAELKGEHDQLVSQSIKQHRNAGKTPKAKVFAWRAIAARVKAWEEIPNSAEAAIPIDECDLGKRERDLWFYRDGDDLVCEDQADRQIEIGKIGRVSFLKYYLRRRG